MVGVNPNKSLFTVNINGLHTVVKIQRFVFSLREKSPIICFKKNPNTNTERMKIKE